MFVKKSVKSQRYMHPVLGKMHIRVLSTARRFTARWKSADIISVTIPRGVSIKEFEEAIDRMTPELLRTRPEMKNYTLGWTYETPEMEFEVVRGNTPGYFNSRIDHAARKLYIEMSPATDDAGSENFNLWVKEVLKRYATYNAEYYLLPFARQLAEELGVRPASIEISYGQRVLGKCFQNGRILLSRNLIFYPVELRRLVIAHEFAHLKHLNHSADFYALLDEYLNGEHARLNAQLKAFKTPFL